MGERGKKEKTERYFSVAEANRLLPKLTALLYRLQELQAEARSRYEEMERIKAVGYRPDGKLILLYDYLQAKEAFSELVGTANSLIQEIHRMGCQLKDLQMGLVDFPALLDGQEVLLCWRLGEAEVAYYHAVDAGFAGRRRLPRPKEEAGGPSS